MNLISVLIITYNQERFIRQAIDSVLMQETTFPVEILVGDDFSTDSTRAIIREYERNFPGRVIGVLHPHNMGKNGGINFLETLKLAKGRYYALMDGDDYWTDSQKLQRQVEYLDAYPACSMVFHNALITYEDGSPPHTLNGPDMKPVYTAADLIGESDEDIWFMATSSTVYRNTIREYPAWFSDSVSGDIPRLLLYAKQGNIGYLPEVMSVYRKNGNGTSFTDKWDDIVFLRNRFAMYSNINRELDYAFDKSYRKKLSSIVRLMIKSRQYRDKFSGRIRFFARYVRMAKPSLEEMKIILRDEVLPRKWVGRYSKVAIKSHRVLNGEAS